MKSLQEVAALLSSQLVRRGMGKLRLASDAGVTPKTLGHVLSGEQDFKVSTLLAVADRLGLELMLVPKEAAKGLVQEPEAPQVKTRVQAALEILARPEDER